MGPSGKKSGTMVVRLVVFLVIFQDAGETLAEGMRDFHDGWLLPISDRASILARAEPVGEEQGSDQGLKNGRSIWGWWVGAGQGRLFSLEELPLKALDCGVVYGAGKWPLSLGVSWERLGESLFLEDTKTLRLMVGRRVRVGLRVRTHSWFVEKDPEDAELEVGLRGGLSFGVGETFAGKIDIWVHGSDIPAWHGRGGRRRMADLRVFHPGLGLALRLDQKDDGVPVFSLEVVGRLTTRMGIGWRVDPETGSLGGGICAAVGGVWLQTSHLVHPALGVTHRLYLGVGDGRASPW